MATNAVVNLSSPLDFGSEKISTITLREPKAKDLRKLSGAPNMGELLDFAARLSDLPSPVLIDDLSIEDTHKILEVVGNYFSAGR